MSLTQTQFNYMHHHLAFTVDPKVTIQLTHAAYAQCPIKLIAGV